MSQPAQILAVADGIVALLNASNLAGDADLGFQAERKYIPMYDVAKVASLKVTVIPKAQASEIETRSDDLKEVKIDIGVQQKVDETAPEKIDALVALVDAIAAVVNRQIVAGYQWLKTENDPIFFPPHLDEFSVFTSVLTLTFKAVG